MASTGKTPNVAVATGLACTNTPNVAVATGEKSVEATQSPSALSSSEWENLRNMRHDLLKEKLAEVRARVEAQRKQREEAAPTQMEGIIGVDSSDGRDEGTPVGNEHQQRPANATSAVADGAVSYTHLTLPTNREV